MTPVEENFMWAWFSAWINNAWLVDNYRSQYAGCAPIRHKQGALRYMTQHLIELDRLREIRPKLSV